MWPCQGSCSLYDSTDFWAVSKTLTGERKMLRELGKKCLNYVSSHFQGDWNRFGLFWGNELRALCCMAGLSRVGRKCIQNNSVKSWNAYNFNENTNPLVFLVHTCMASHTQEFTCACTQKHIHEHICTHIYSCIHKCTCAHTHSNRQPFVQMDMNTKVRQGRRKREGYIGKNLSRKQCLQYKYPDRGGSKVDVSSVLFHWSICLFLCRYHTVLMIVAWSDSWANIQRKLQFEKIRAPLCS